MNILYTIKPDHTMASVETHFTQTEPTGLHGKRYLEYYLNGPILLDESGLVQPGSIVFMKPEAFPQRAVSTHQQNPEDCRHHYFLITGTHRSGTLHLTPISVADDMRTLQVDATIGSHMLTPESVRRITGRKRAKPTDLIFAVLHPDTLAELNTEVLRAHLVRFPVGDDSALRY